IDKIRHVSTANLHKRHMAHISKTTNATTNMRATRTTPIFFFFLINKNQLRASVISLKKALKNHLLLGQFGLQLRILRTRPVSNQAVGSSGGVAQPRNEIEPCRRAKNGADPAPQNHYD
ncbi:hypothetical protein TorRG33x02_054720, partial [Trema orientale]